MNSATEFSSAKRKPINNKIHSHRRHTQSEQQKLLTHESRIFDVENFRQSILLFLSYFFQIRAKNLLFCYFH